MSGSFGVVESSWLPEWAQKHGFERADVTTTNNVAMERGLNGWRINQDLRARYPKEYPKPIDKNMARNRRAYRTADWDRFFDYLASEGESIGTRPARLGPPPEPAKPTPTVPAQRKALPDPHSKAGRLLASNAKERERVHKQTGELNLLQGEIDDLVRQILDIDQGNGQSARDARHAEINALEQQIETLKQKLRDLRNADRKANAFTEADLPKLRAELADLIEDASLLRTVIWGGRAAITRRHRQIVAAFGEIDEQELPQVRESSETDQLLREIAAGTLTTLAGAATRLGATVTVQQLRDGKKRWKEFPEPVGVHPNKTSGDLYEFRLIEAAAKKHGLVYTDDEVPAP